MWVRVTVRTIFLRVRVRARVTKLCKLERAPRVRVHSGKGASVVMGFEVVTTMPRLHIRVVARVVARVMYGGRARRRRLLGDDPMHEPE